MTSQVLDCVPEIATVQTGLLHVFIQHTSASLTINENADPDVRVDFETAMNHAVPESLPYVHTIEGRDDMPAHVKASMMGASVQIPAADGCCWAPGRAFISASIATTADRENWC